MIKRVLPALCLTALATTFCFGLIFGANDYVVKLSGATEGASLINSLIPPSELAFGGYTGSNSSVGAHTTGSGGGYGVGGGGSSPSPSTGAHTSNPGGGGNTGGTTHSSGPGGDGCGGCGGGTSNGGTNGNGSASTGNGGSGGKSSVGAHTTGSGGGYGVGGGGGSLGGGRPSENSGTGPNDSFGGGKNNTGGGTGNSSSNSGCGGNCNGGGDGSSFNGNSNTGAPTGDSRDHQDTNTSRAQEQQAQQTREAANYAKTLSGYASAAPTPSMVNDKITGAWNALNNAIFGQEAQQALDAANNRTVIGLDGNTPVYSGTGLTKNDFTTTVPGAPTISVDNGVNLSQAWQRGTLSDGTTAIKNDISPSVPATAQRNVEEFNQPSVNVPQVNLTTLAKYAKFGQVTKGYTTKPYSFALSPTVARSILNNNTSPLQRDAMQPAYDKLSPAQTVVAGVIANQASIQNVPLGTALGMGAIETAFGAKKDRPGSQYQGPAQIGNNEFNTYASPDAAALGKTNVFANIQAGVSYMKSITTQLNKAGIKDPSAGQVYASYNQGVAGFTKLSANPNATAASIVGERKVHDNLPGKLQSKASTMTAKDFVSVIANYPAHSFNAITGSSLPSGSASVNAPANTSATTQAVSTKTTTAPAKNDAPSNNQTAPAAHPGVVNTVVTSISNGVKNIVVGGSNSGTVNTTSNNNQTGGGGSSHDFFPVPPQVPTQTATWNPGSEITTARTNNMIALISGLMNSDGSALISHTISASTLSYGTLYELHDFYSYLNGMKLHYQIGASIGSGGKATIRYIQLAAELTDSRGLHTYKYLDNGPDGVIDAYGIDTVDPSIGSQKVMSAAQSDFDSIVARTISNI